MAKCIRRIIDGESLILLYNDAPDLNCSPWSRFLDPHQLNIHQSEERLARHLSSSVSQLTRSKYKLCKDNLQNIHTRRLSQKLMARVFSFLLGHPTHILKQKATVSLKRPWNGVFYDSFFCSLSLSHGSMTLLSPDGEDTGTLGANPENLKMRKKSMRICKIQKKVQRRESLLLCPPQWK